MPQRAGLVGLLFYKLRCLWRVFKASEFKRATISLGPDRPEA